MAQKEIATPILPSPRYMPVLSTIVRAPALLNQGQPTSGKHLRATNTLPPSPNPTYIKTNCGLQGYTYFSSFCSKHRLCVFLNCENPGSVAIMRSGFYKPGSLTNQKLRYISPSAGLPISDLSLQRNVIEPRTKSRSVILRCENNRECQTQVKTEKNATKSKFC